MSGLVLLGMLTLEGMVENIRLYQMFFKIL